MKILSSFLLSCLLTITVTLSGQNTDTTFKKEEAKSGLNFGALPAVSFDSDLGFQYGIIGNLFNYGDGTIYPDYKWSLYGEWSRTTKGSGTNQLFFDSKYILPRGIRITADISLLTEQALDFYGFNGFEATYVPQYEEDEDPMYISRMFYRHDREILRISFDFQGKLIGNDWKWLAGVGYYSAEISSVDIDKLNKGLDDDKKLPEVDGLYDMYVNWGLIAPEEADGGSNRNIKLGIIYDSRDNEPNPNKGLWTEALIMTAPEFLGNNESAYTKLSIIHRQYLPIIYNKLTFAYRLGWQGTIGGNAPFYMQPYMINSFTRATKNDGLGGAKSLRGVLRNRVVGDAIAYSNIELRYKALQFNKWKQNFYISLNGFGDFGMVTKPIDVDINKVPVSVDRSNFFDQNSDKLHASYGLGTRIAMNQNFILAVDYGIAADKRDGDGGLYINIGFLF